MKYDAAPYHGPFNEQTIWMHNMIEQSRSPIELYCLKLLMANFVLSHYDQASLATIANNHL